MPMDSPILPTSRFGPALLAAIQAQQGEAQIQNLLALVGESLDLLLLAAEPGRVRLQLPSGQVFDAEGELPYPAGTRLTVQVQPPGPDSAAPRLQLREALPPPPAPILAPLQQGEARHLLARLQAPEPASEVAALARLLVELGPAPAPAAAAATGPAEPPIAARLLEFVQELPPTEQRALERILLPTVQGRPTRPELAAALRVLLQPSEPQRTPTNGGPIPPAPARTTPATAPAAAPPNAPTAAPLSAPTEPTAPLRATRSEPIPLPAPDAAVAGLPYPPMLARTPPPPTGDPALEPLKNLLLLLLRPTADRSEHGSRLVELLHELAPDAAPKSPKAPASAPGETNGAPNPPAPGPVRVGIPKAQATPTKSVAPNKPTAGPPAATPTAEPPSRGHAGAAPLPAPPAGPADSAAARASSWESWMSAGVKALSDPRISPREAPFHLAQAREGTAFFELPLPWEGAERTLQLWVESEAGKGTHDSAETTVRVLVGVQFSALGETRVGLVQSGTQLQVRIWAERADLLKAHEDALRSDLAELGPNLDFQVHPLGEPGVAVPSLRALANGSGFQALG